MGGRHFRAEVRVPFGFGLEGRRPWRCCLSRARGSVPPGLRCRASRGPLAAPSARLRLRAPPRDGNAAPPRTGGRSPGPGASGAAARVAAGAGTEAAEGAWPHAGTSVEGSGCRRRCSRQESPGPPAGGAARVPGSGSAREGACRLQPAAFLSAPGACAGPEIAPAAGDGGRACSDCLPPRPGDESLPRGLALGGSRYVPLSTHEGSGSWGGWSGERLLRC